jgi:hypothetical protein
MNLETEQVQTARMRASKKHYQTHTEYYKKYYQEHKEKWNDYTPKLCECGLTVSSLTIHKKSKLHNKLMAMK